MDRRKIRLTTRFKLTDKGKRVLTPRYRVLDADQYAIPKICKHFVDKMKGEKGSLLVVGKCKKCKASVWQDRVSWLEEKSKRGL